ncbi:hypothetical protein ACFC5T_17695 [Streptomyces sp. NPDC055961]|uniref:hypothetical protein n=1 Tax=Streptomyces sp. NPDC055961 TaxID=3345666 RepID=UPI0035D92660
MASTPTSPTDHWEHATRMTLTIYAPALPCGRFPAQCTNDGATEHAAHDWNLPSATHAGWHCYGYSTTPSGTRVGWAGGTEEPGDAMDLCQNNPATPAAS